MQKLIFGALLATFGFASAVNAADLGSYKYATAPTTTSIWAGPYMGINVGGVFDYNEVGGIASKTYDSIGASSFNVGLVGGYDFVLNNFIIGGWAEGTLESGIAQITPYKINTEGNWATGGKIGYVVATNLAVYGKLGYTMEALETTLPAHKNGLLPGITYGGGIEYALSTNLFLRTEYRHNDYAGVNIGATGTSASASAIHDALGEDRVTLGFSYKFNGTNSNPLNIFSSASYK